MRIRLEGMVYPSQKMGRGVHVSEPDSASQILQTPERLWKVEYKARKCPLRGEVYPSQILQARFCKPGEGFGKLNTRPGSVPIWGMVYRSNFFHSMGCFINESLL